MASLLRWCNRYTRGHDHITPATDLNTCWGDGLLFCALLYTWFPEKIPIQTLKAATLQDKLYNLNLAFKVGEETGAEPFLDAEDTAEIQDTKSIIVYLSEIYNNVKDLPVKFEASYEWNRKFEAAEQAKKEEEYRKKLEAERAAAPSAESPTVKLGDLASKMAAKRAEEIAREREEEEKFAKSRTSTDFTRQSPEEEEEMRRARAEGVQTVDASAVEYSITGKGAKGGPAKSMLIFTCNITVSGKKPSAGIKTDLEVLIECPTGDLRVNVMGGPGGAFHVGFNPPEPGQYWIDFVYLGTLVEKTFLLEITDAARKVPENPYTGKVKKEWLAKNGSSSAKPTSVDRSNENALAAKLEEEKSAVERAIAERAAAEKAAREAAERAAAEKAAREASERAAAEKAAREAAERAAAEKAAREAAERAAAEKAAAEKAATEKAAAEKAAAEKAAREAAERAAAEKAAREAAERAAREEEERIEAERERIRLEEEHLARLQAEEDAALRAAEEAAIAAAQAEAAEAAEAAAMLALAEAEAARAEEIQAQLAAQLKEAEEAAERAQAELRAVEELELKRIAEEKSRGDAASAALEAAEAAVAASTSNLTPEEIISLRAEAKQIAEAVITDDYVEPDPTVTKFGFVSGITFSFNTLTRHGQKTSRAGETSRFLALSNGLDGSALVEDGGDGSYLYEHLVSPGTNTVDIKLDGLSLKGFPLVFEVPNLSADIEAAHREHLSKLELARAQIEADELQRLVKEKTVQKELEAQKALEAARLLKLEQEAAAARARVEGQAQKEQKEVAQVLALRNAAQARQAQGSVNDARSSHEDDISAKPASSIRNVFEAKVQQAQVVPERPPVGRNTSVGRGGKSKLASMWEQTIAQNKK
uniref:110 kDa actin binding protein interacting with anti-filamin antibody n=1 Tax=Amoeba proteus TaxID=5775 RepID=Q1A232_AMOPR|nr:110 kDa actin binding protein interacting with anti-filamin antibody [Amoeba proteus]